MSEVQPTESSAPSVFIPTYSGTFAKLRQTPCTVCFETEDTTKDLPKNCYLVFDHESLRDTFISTLKSLCDKYNDQPNILVVPEACVDMLDFQDKSSRSEGSRNRIALEKDLKGFLLEVHKAHYVRFQNAFEYDWRLIQQENIREASASPEDPPDMRLVVACASFFKEKGKETKREVRIVSKNEEVSALAKKLAIECIHL